MNFILSFLVKTAFIWIPIILGRIFLWVWRSYKTSWFLSKKLKYKMLEINIPRDVYKSPEAMEMVIDVLHHLGGGVMGWKERLWFGATFYPSSLEIASIEGSIYFFIRSSDKMTELVKSTIYSQYPQAEVHEVDDYTRYVPDYETHQDSWSIYAADYTLASEDYIPIKTYVDYGLDKAVGSLEEEEKIDPITPMLEYLGTLRAGEQIWIQFIIRADTFSVWRKQAAEKIKEIMGRGQEVTDDEPFQTVKLTHGEQEMVKGIERSLSKHSFECVIRAVYLAKNENVNWGHKGFFKGNIFKPFTSHSFNGFRKNTDTGFDWVWQDITNTRNKKLGVRFFNDYINRTAFHESFSKYLNFFWYKKNKPFILTSEELATLFHIPGRVSETGSIERIEAIKSEPPTNLPI